MQPELKFEGLPESVLLNLELDVHQAWLAFAKEAKQDLDNIRLADLPASDRHRGVRAVFELEGLVIEGHCRDMQLEGTPPPRGLELELLDRSGRDNYSADSLVMANLGYVQLQVPHPGLFELRIRPQSRSSQIYTLADLGVDGFKSGLVQDQTTQTTAQSGRAALLSLDGLVLYPQFTRQAGMEEADVLAQTPISLPQPEGWLSRLVGLAKQSLEHVCSPSV